MVDSLSSENAYGRLLVALGSGLMWVWVNCIFMGIPFLSGNGRMHLLALVVFFLASALVCASCLVNPSGFTAVLGIRHLPVFLALLGAAGSVATVLADLFHSWLALVAGAVLAGMVYGFMLMLWARFYGQNGIRYSTFMVAASFAVAGLIDIPLLFLVPVGQLVAFVLFPALSAVCLALLRPSAFPRRVVDSAESEGQRDSRVLFGTRTVFQLPVVFVAAVACFMVAFGYIQSLLTFSAFSGSLRINGVDLNGVVLQLARFVSAGLVLVFTARLESRLATVYRVGFYLMVAGFLTLPSVSMLADSQLAAMVTGGIIMVGYTCFDIFVWSVVCETFLVFGSRASAGQPFAAVRVVIHMSLVVGLLLGAFLGVSGPVEGARFTATTSVVTYLLVLAVTMLLGGAGGLWQFVRTRAELPTEGSKGVAGIPERLAAEAGLTQREIEVADLILQGRSAARIAEALGISEHTVVSHTRHIYDKLRVHGKQELIDLVGAS